MDCRDSTPHYFGVLRYSWGLANQRGPERVRSWCFTASKNADPSEKLEATERVRNVVLPTTDKLAPCSKQNRNGEQKASVLGLVSDGRALNSPLLDLPIRQVMGDAHYLSQ